MKRLALVLAAVALTVPLAAEPVGMVRVPAPKYDYAFQWMLAKFPDVYADDVRLRMVVTPSFSPMWAVALKHTGGSYRIVYANPLLDLPNPGPIKPPVSERSCEAPIDAALAERLIGVWDRMLTNYFPRQPESWDTGGVTYSFALRQGMLEKRTSIASPKPNTPPAVFGALGSDLAAYCTTARSWVWAPATWWNGKLIGEKLDKLDTVLKGTKPGDVTDELNSWPGRFPAEDHLAPAEPPKRAAAQGDEEALIEQILFKEAFGPNVRARVRMLILPNLVEVMAFITEDKGHYRLVRLHSPQILLSIIRPYIPRHGDPPPKPIDPHKIVVMRLSDDLPPALAKEIIADWKDALIWAVPLGRGHRGSDGTRSVFSMEDQTGAYAGLSWSSYQLPVLDALQAVASDMAIICEYGAKTSDKCYFTGSGNLAGDVKELTKALKAKRQ